MRALTVDPKSSSKLIEALLELMAAGKPHAPIGWRGAWDRASEAAQALTTHRLQGKAILDIVDFEGERQ